MKHLIVLILLILWPFATSLTRLPERQRCLTKLRRLERLSFPFLMLETIIFQLSPALCVHLIEKGYNTIHKCDLRICVGPSMFLIPI